MKSSTAQCEGIKTTLYASRGIRKVLRCRNKNPPPPPHRVSQSLLTRAAYLVVPVIICVSRTFRSRDLEKKRLLVLKTKGIGSTFGIKRCKILCFPCFFLREFFSRALLSERQEQGRSLVACDITMPGWPVVA